MAKRKEQVTEQDHQDLTEDPQEENQTSTVPVEDEPAQVVGNKEPAKSDLHVPQESGNLAPAKSKEEIEAAIQEKLSRRDDKSGVDPFVPSSQLENEVKEIATKQGFPLSRGTEIGARLMARAKRK